MSQCRIRLLSLMVATSLFTGGMATLAEPVSAKNERKHAKKANKKANKKAKKKHHHRRHHHEGEEEAGAVSESAVSNKEMDQEATTTNTQDQSGSSNVQFACPAGACGPWTSTNASTQGDFQSGNASAVNSG
jgi:flagellar basal body-associated protein FliL